MASIVRGTPKLSAYAMHTRYSQKKAEEKSNADYNSPNGSPEFKQTKDGKVGRKRKPTNESVTSDMELTKKDKKKQKSHLNESDEATEQGFVKERGDVGNELHSSLTENNVQNTRKDTPGKRKVKVGKEQNSKAADVEFEMSEEEHLSSTELNGSVPFVTSTPVASRNPDEPLDFSCGNEAADACAGWLLHPLKPKSFLEKKWEKKPVHIPRTNPNYYHGLFSLKDFNKIIKENLLKYGDEIDIVSYSDGKRQPVMSDMRVYPSFVWSAYQAGNSIRMRNPHSFSKPLWNLCSLLQEYFSNSVGVNMYLTPPGSQGFPPHYDDIDAFVLQIEGKKIWKLYEPRSDNEALPRFSSGDLNEDEIGTPFAEFELKAGDMLYFPRGIIHQAKSTENEHSLHLTVSTNQLNTYGDLLQAEFPTALESAIANDVEFRQSLPKDYLDFVGSAYSTHDSTQRQAFQKHVKYLAQKAVKYFSVDHAADVHAADFIHKSMPPLFNKKESSCSIHGNGARIEGGEEISIADLTPKTKIRWIRKRAFRLVVEEKGAQLFYSLGNSKNQKEEEPLCMDLDDDVVPAICALFQAHPNYIKVKDLPAEDIDLKLSLAQQLYDNGFLVTEKPLPPAEDEDNA